MPKDKKSKEKEAGCSSKETEPVKRKNSIVDSSGSSSSSSSDSSSSDRSGNASDHSQSCDSDVGFENDKGTMTGDSEPGSSGTNNAHCSVQIRDRTDELRKMMNENNAAERVPVRLVNAQNVVPVSADTHLVPIESSTPSPPSESAKKATSSKVVMKAPQVNKKGKQAKQLTKKQRKELERKEMEKKGGVVSYPGHKAPPKKGRVVGQDLVVGQDNEPHAHHFEEWTGDEVKDGEMVVRAKNAAAQACLGGSETVVPFYRKDEELGPPMHYTDLHKNSQKRYLTYVNTIGAYTALQAPIKLCHRMGYGVAASGIPDDNLLSLTISGAKPFMKYQYQDYVASGHKITNWRSEFASSADMDHANHDGCYIEIMNTLKDYIDELINTTKDGFHRSTLRRLRDCDLRDMLLRFGEMERIITRREQDFRGAGIGLLRVMARFDSLDRSERVTYMTRQVLDWSTRAYTEDYGDGDIEMREVSILQYLVCTLTGEKPCYEMHHRKCSTLYFLLAKTDNRQNHLRAKFFGGHTLLHLAAMTGNPCQIDVLLRFGAPINELNDHFKAPIALAMRRQANLIARQLMWHGADLGGAFSLVHIQPKTSRQEHQKELAEYFDYIGRQIGFKSRDYMTNRMRALNNTFISWVEAILVDSEGRVPLGVDSVKSSLHQFRIGPDAADVAVTNNNRSYLKKTFSMAIERSEFEKEPVVLFMIPCQYSSFDSTMPATAPHIVRVPMVTEANTTAAAIAEKEKIRKENGQQRTVYTEDVKNLRPIRILGQPITISYGDGAVCQRQLLEPFFAYEHNGMIYGYNLPDCVTKSENKYVSITIEMIIPESESQRFPNTFFMAQAVQVVVRGQEKSKVVVGETIGGTPSDKEKDPREDEISAMVAAKKSEVVAAEAQKVVEKEKQYDRVLDIVTEVQTKVKDRKESGFVSGRKTSEQVIQVIKLDETTNGKSQKRNNTVKESATVPAASSASKKGDAAKQEPSPPIKPPKTKTE